MRHLATYRKIFALAGVMVFFGLFVGNLVNFHVHHIFHKQLIPDFATGKREKPKYFSFNLSTSKADAGDEQCASCPLFGGEEERLVRAMVSDANILLPADLREGIPAAASPASHGLRAPPSL